MMMISRRGFLDQSFKGLSAATLFHLFPGIRFALATDLFSHAQDLDHFFVTLEAQGGLDATLGLDPQVLTPGLTEQDIFLEYRPEDILTAQGLRLGPAAKAIVPYAHLCAIVNGVMMRRDAGHPACQQYIQTGRGDGTAGAVPVELASTLDPGPFGVAFDGYIYPGRRTPILTSLQDLLKSDDLNAVADLLDWVTSGTQGSPLEEAKKNIVTGKPITQKLTDTLAEFRKSQTQLTAVHALAALFVSGASRFGRLSVDESGSLDTHTGHVGVHFKLQTTVWEKVAEIFKLFSSIPFKSGSLMDHTTFAVITEFSRTPFLNGAKGKDHNAYTNSILFAGKGIRGGTTLGASRVIPKAKSKLADALHYAMPFDYKTGKPVDSQEGASFIFPENIVRSIGELFGSPKDFPIDSSVPAIPGLLKTT